MSPESDTAAALRRAAGRAGYHSVKALVELLKAVEAVVDELGRVRRPDDAEPPGGEGRVRIDLE